MYSLAVRKALIALAVLMAVAVAGLAATVRHGEVGYFSPQFTPDGSAIVVVVREPHVSSVAARLGTTRVVISGELHDGASR